MALPVFKIGRLPLTAGGLGSTPRRFRQPKHPLQAHLPLQASALGAVWGFRVYVEAMLRLYRRHRTSCPKTSERYRRCACPIYVEGSLAGEYIRKALDLTSWEAASNLINGWNAAGRIGAVQQRAQTLEEAVDLYLADCETRNLAETTMRKRRLLLKKQFLGWCRGRGLIRFGQIDGVAMREFRNSWEDAPLSSLKKLERLRSFFRFCVDSGWTDKNPVLGIKPPQVEPNPTLPFSQEEVQKILSACDRYEGDKNRMRAFILVMLYSGLRISDTCTLRRDAVRNGKIFLRQAKTGQPVYVPVPPCVTEALDRVKGNGEFYFWSGKGKVLTIVGNWRKYLTWLFKKSGVKGARSHRFRDTFSVSLLERGVDIETVSVLLGHASIKVTEKHYRPWVKSLQTNLEEAVRRTWIQAVA